ncbi:tetratricopeptide repeat protein [Rhizorhapis suberifaciens]|uniref:Cytochrome c-type biogenesis protein CcmH/NrfG n=1 Tax=Rhizorhapis suberifaciens TaxID=13656 RepID=A0A840HXR4_9SPHN|nr:tetratricopeptide repeat protein [Rhizorhapis suberifaciens]MBB4642308.1 cytochrome c-type biogenesis protein CcmH/NrfG [Rhizorhapis suberifaciens]
MNGWFIIVVLTALAGAAIIRFGRAERATFELVAAALLIGLAGYAWQGSPSQRGFPVKVAGQDSAFDEDVAKQRKEMGERFSQAGQWLVLSDAFNRRGKNEEAANVLRVGLRQYPDDPNLWLGLGNALMVHGGGVMSPAAEFAFRRAIKLAPEMPAPAYFYGLALAQSGQPQQAEKIWRDLLKRTSADAEWRGDLETNLGILERSLNGGAAPAQGDSSLSENGTGALEQ